MWPDYSFRLIHIVPRQVRAEKQHENKWYRVEKKQCCAEKNEKDAQYETKHTSLSGMYTCRTEASHGDHTMEY